MYDGRHAKKDRQQRAHGCRSAPAVSRTRLSRHRSVRRRHRERRPARVDLLSLPRRQGGASHRGYLLHASDPIAQINRAAAATTTAAQLIETFIGRERDELVASNYREGCAVAPIVIEATPASDQLSDATRRAFQDVIATLAARLAEKGLAHENALEMATNVWTSVEGALILSRALRSPDPFDMAIALLTAAADQVHSAR